MRPLRLVLETLCMRSSLAEQSAVIQKMEESNAGVEYAVVNAQMRILRGSGRMLRLLNATRCDGQSLDSIRAGIQALGRRSSGPRDCIDVVLPDGQPATLNAVADCYILVPDSVSPRPVPCLPAARVHPAERLTSREQQVMEQLATGSSNASIAEILSISVRTVENHLRSIYDKLGINSRTQLISLLFGH